MYASSNLILPVLAWLQDYREASVEEGAAKEEVIPHEAENEEIISTLITVVQFSVQL